MNTNMNRRRFSASLLSAAAASALVPSGQAFAQAGPVEGKDFVRVETPQPPGVPGLTPIVHRWRRGVWIGRHLDG